MIGFVEAIAQDQLFLSHNLPGWVNVHYPRGATTVLSVNLNSTPMAIGTQPAGTDGRFEEFQVRADGHLQAFSDNPHGGAVIIPGLQLVMPTA